MMDGLIPPADMTTVELIRAIRAPGLPVPYRDAVDAELARRIDRLTSAAEVPTELAHAS